MRHSSNWVVSGGAECAIVPIGWSMAAPKAPKSIAGGEAPGAFPRITSALQGPRIERSPNLNMFRTFE